MTVERSFGTTVLPGMRHPSVSDRSDQSRRYRCAASFLRGRAPFYTIDNMEGIAVSREPDGETRLTLISDDNFRRDIQRTLLLQFSLRD